MKKVIATPLDPLVARDGRPFGTGGVAHSHSWLMPSVFSGSLRTAVGKKIGLSFTDNDELTRLKNNISTTGALPYLENEGESILYVPKPFDCVVSESGNVRKAYVVRPELGENEGVNWPDCINLLPAMLQGDNDEAFKPVSTVPFWSFERMCKWLATPRLKTDARVTIRDFPQLTRTVNYLEGLDEFLVDERVGVKIDKDTGRAKDSCLFTTVGLDLYNEEAKRSIALYSQVELNDYDVGDTMLSSLGGKKRLANWKVSEVNGNPFNAPREIVNAANDQNGKKRVRMVLATPAIFKKGYYPGWLEKKNDFLMGNPPSCASVKLKLVSMAIDRWIPVSGWDLAKKAPKAVRRLAPAGGVYFFEIEEGNANELFTSAWFKSVCDDEQDRRDGFGVALWGVW